MASGDHYLCNSCKYEWRTRKDVGKPGFCPKCKWDKIVNVSVQEYNEQININEDSNYNAEKICKVGVKVLPEFHYLVDDNGNIIRENEGKTQLVARIGIKKQSGYLYFVDKDGDVSRRKSSWS